MVSHKPGKLNKERTQWNPEGKQTHVFSKVCLLLPCVTPSHAAAAVSSPLRKADISLPLLSLHQLPSCSEHPEITSSMQTVFLISKTIYCLRTHQIANKLHQKIGLADVTSLWSPAVVGRISSSKPVLASLQFHVKGQPGLHESLSQKKNK